MRCLTDVNHTIQDRSVRYAKHHPAKDDLKKNYLELGNYTSVFLRRSSGPSPKISDLWGSQLLATSAASFNL
ncbi:hypothetical protein EYC84_012056 [Monilinia fructicola]|uniref:Uncharacterized protein n=1 Tax=Monilinia fructicola TaxID=38448 RepID=A0A5M9J5U7_MONFR|nr:hypothetical protein EYC84_012056 [Monilinia fructicola]